MPNTYNVAIVGMKETGKKTYAKMLNEKYGWRIVDVEKIIGEKMA
jgi:dephospho-CoA kinase